MFIFFVFAVIFLSGSRASLFLSILFIILFFLFVRSYQKQILILGIIFLISFIITAKFNEKFAYKSHYNIVDPIKRILTTKQGNYENKVEKDLNLTNINFTIFTSIHESHFITAYKIFNENKIFGVGNKMFRVLCSKEEYKINEFSCSTHPHNYYLQILSENGIIGFLIISILFTICIYNLIKKFYFRYFCKLKKINDPCIIILIGLFINLWPIVPTGNIFNNWLSILIYFPLGFYYFLKKTISMYSFIIFLVILNFIFLYYFKNFAKLCGLYDVPNKRKNSSSQHTIDRRILFFYKFIFPFFIFCNFFEFQFTKFRYG